MDLRSKRHEFNSADTFDYCASHEEDFNLNFAAMMERFAWEEQALQDGIVDIAELAAQVNERPFGRS
jgi:hypothetical protein